MPRAWLRRAPWSSGIRGCRSRPVSFKTPPNALRIAWQSKPGGGWEAEIHLVDFRNRFPEMTGKNLYLWCYSEEKIAAKDLPEVVLSNAREGLQIAQFPGSFTAPEPLGKFAGDIPARRWIQVRIPLDKLRTASVYAFHPEYLASVIFHQGQADGAKHTLIVDEIRIADEPASGSDSATVPEAPKNVSAEGYDRHIEVRWNDDDSPNVARFVIYRSMDGSDFKPVGMQVPGIRRYMDFLGKPDAKATYKVTAEDWQYRASAIVGGGERSDTADER